MKQSRLFITSAIIFLSIVLDARAKSRSEIGIGFNVNVQKLIGDTRSGGLKFGGNPVLVRYNFQPFAFVETDMGLSQLSTTIRGMKQDTELWNVGVKLGYRLLHEKRIHPLFYLGLGVFNFSMGNERYWDAYGACGGGLEYFFNTYLGVNVTADYRYTSGDDFDGGDASFHKDAFVNISLGANYYLGVGAAPRSKSRNGNGRAKISEVKTKAANGYRASNGNVTANLKTLHTERLLLEQSVDGKNADIRLLQARIAALDQEYKTLESKLAANGYRNDATDGASASSLIHKRYRTGLLYYEAEVYEEAVLTFRSIIHEHAHHPAALSSWYWLGESYYALKDYPAAASAFELTLLKAPLSTKSQMAQFMLGLCYLKAGEAAKARHQFELVLKAPLNAEYVNLAKSYLAELRKN